MTVLINQNHWPYIINSVDQVYRENIITSKEIIERLILSTSKDVYIAEEYTSMTARIAQSSLVILTDISDLAWNKITDMANDYTSPSWTRDGSIINGRRCFFYIANINLAIEHKPKEVSLICKEVSSYLYRWYHPEKITAKNFQKVLV